MSPEGWGPPTWTLFHTLAEKINPDNFNQLFPSLITFIRRICSALPCPDCSEHASRFLAQINYSTIKNKDDLKGMLYIFHNSVNKRKNKGLYQFSNLATYANGNTINAFNNFVAVYQTRGNMKLLAESFQRKLIIADFKKWLIANIRYFL